jgi:cyclase
MAGSSSIVASVDIQKNNNSYYVFSCSGTKLLSKDLGSFITYVLSLSVGEIIINFIDREGTYQGYDLECIKYVSSLSDAPVIPLGGLRDIKDFYNAINYGAHGVAASSFFVYYGKKKAVLISYNI